MSISLEIVPEKLFFNVFSGQPEFMNSVPSRLQTQIQIPDIFDNLYIPFAFDFGPPNIAQIYRFVKIFDNLLTETKQKIIWYSLSDQVENTTNAACLMGGYCIFSLGWTAGTVIEKFTILKDHLAFYRDASQLQQTYKLELFTCFIAMEKAKRLGWIDFKTFDLNEYQFYEQVENGDFNWIVPHKFIAMCTPTAIPRRTDTSVSHTPDYYIRYFQSHGVTTIIRLNTAEYDRNSFLKVGIDHHDMYFIDGTVPTLQIVEKFLQVVENAPGAIAVHCKQGLGRTGTLIACYIMKHYDFDAAECIAFLRLQRPGSVVGPQQQFLHKIEPLMKVPKTTNSEPLSPIHNRPSTPVCGGSPAVIALKKTTEARRITPLKA